MGQNEIFTFTDFLQDNGVVIIVVLVVAFLVVVYLLLQKIREQRAADERQRLATADVEIEELEQAISSLLDNMPGLHSTKDAKTGVYLACNQAFAEFAHRKGPEDVIGLTDAQLFDDETARRLAQDDEMALSMDEPYIFFEDLEGVDGKRMHIKTTKLKYTDDVGRLCVLGFSQDVTTDTFRIRRDEATTKEAYENARSAGAAFAHLAQALAQGYESLYHVDLNTEAFIEYHAEAEGGNLVEVRRGWHFFELCQDEITHMIHPEDQKAVAHALERKTLVAALERNNTFMMEYRLVEGDITKYVNMKVTRMRDDKRFIVMGVTNVDEQVRQRNAATQMKEERIASARISALAGDFLCIYVVDPETGRYRELSTTAAYEGVVRPHEGTDFFADSRKEGRSVLHPEDLNLYLSALTSENVIADVESHGIFTLSYRLMIDEVPRYVQLKAVMLEEAEGKRLIVGVNDIDVQVRQEEDYVKHLAQAEMDANIDTLTGVKNRHAYRFAEGNLNAQIAENPALEFAIVVLDVNGLKEVNDVEGHKAGDRFLRDACKIVCTTFKHSPVFRVGGDEFAVISQGDDYAAIDELVAQMQAHNAEAQRNGGIVIACGMARRAGDASVSQVFERADQLMYANKSELKAKVAPRGPEGSDSGVLA